jgi:cold shock CspA family protein
LSFENKVFQCEIKWFKNGNGYGFARCNEFENQDIFIHHTALGDACQNNAVSPGDELVCEIVQGVHGPQVSKVHSYKQNQDLNTLIEASGVIKWFNKEKDFGFIKTTDSEFDIFMRGQLLRDLGINPDSMTPGAPVNCTFTLQNHRKVAKSITLMGEEYKYAIK